MYTLQVFKTNNSLERCAGKIKDKKKKTYIVVAAKILD